MTEQQPTTIESALADFGTINQKSGVDVVLKLLQSPALYHSEIVNVPVMNAIKLQIALCTSKGYNKSAEVWTTLYDALIDHMVSHKRKRAIEIKDMFNSLMALVNMDNNQQKKGLFNR